MTIGDELVVVPGLRSGTVELPPSKSILHRLLIADFLYGSRNLADYEPHAGDCDDIAATRRSLKALAAHLSVQCKGTLELDVGESASTLRFLTPVTKALGLDVHFRCRGSLNHRPEGTDEISSQSVSGELLASCLYEVPRSVACPVVSRGYVEMTHRVLNNRNSVRLEADASAAAIWLAANALGHRIQFKGDFSDLQPDQAMGDILSRLLRGNAVIDLTDTPDLYPPLRLVDGVKSLNTRFNGIERLRFKESNRIKAMDALLSSRDEFNCRGDHRIAMCAIIYASLSSRPMRLYGVNCVAKSYPTFIDSWLSLSFV